MIPGDGHSEDARRGTYEVYIDVRHHPRHLDDHEKRESTAFKLVEQPGDPRLMVAHALRDFAAELGTRVHSDALKAGLERRRAEARVRWEERQR